MNMQYWQNQDTQEVYGFDISDPSQIIARNNLISTGNWEDVTNSWPPPPSPPTAEQNKNKAITLLSATDFVVLSDVDDPALNPHLLNKTDFINYRNIIRNIAVNPVAGDINWPVKPTEQWST